MQSVEHCDKKKVDCKVSSASSSVPSTSKTTIANHSGNEKINMSATEIKLKNQFCNSNKKTIKEVLENYTEIRPCVVDSSESDEESVSEILLAWLCLRPEYLGDLGEEIPESCSDCEQDDEEVEDEEDDDECDEDDDDECDEEDDEDEDDDNDDEDDDDDVDDEEGSGEITDDESVDLIQPTTRLEALLEAAEHENVPALRNASLALNDAAQELSRMRSETSSRDRNLLSRTLIAACADNDVNTVRRLLGDGNNTLNEGTDDGESLLSLACSAGYYELAQVLLAMSAQVEDRGQKNDCTPLMEAASAGHVDIIKLLISHSADVNAQSSTGNTPLMYACAGGHVRAVKELLSSGANVEDHNENGHTPLMEAASAGHVEVAKILLEHGAGINTHSNEFKESALTLACYKGHLDMVRFLLEAGADQEHKTDEMHTALMEASMDGHVEVARLLLDSGAQVNMPTDSFESPLTLAACGGHVDLAMLLLERGANIEEVNDEGYTPLMEASREGHEEMAALLLSQGANINAQTEETQETALTLACCGGFLEVADYLLKNGADLEIGASTPLMEAAQEGHIELVRFLLENRANVHAQTQTGDTALTYACENGHTDVAEVLLYYGAELEHESEGGRTPLMKACRAGHICTIKFLINKGADVNRQSTSNDHTPLSLACAGGHQSVVELLLKSGADPFHKLKDNSTMLIEASKGGHIGVVQLLLDYPNSMIPQVSSMKVTNSGEMLHLQKPALATEAEQLQSNQPPIQVQQQPQIQQQEQQLQQQQQLQAQEQQQKQQSHPQQPSSPIQQNLLESPSIQESQATNEQQNICSTQIYPTTGLQEVPEVEQIFQNQITPSDAALSLQNILLNSNAKNSSIELQDSILANMRFLRNQGFKDGLALGLARFGLVNNNNNNNSNNNNTATNSVAIANTNTSISNNVIVSNSNSIISNINSEQNATPSITSLPTVSVPVPAPVTSTLVHNTTVKQKSLLRKSRQPPAPFELNEMTRVHPFLMDLKKTFATATDKQAPKSANFGDEFKLLESSELSKIPFQPICDTSATATSFIPTSYTDLSATATNGTLTTKCATGTTNASTLLSYANSATPYTTPSPIAAPSEVLPNTAISDRPKVKSVSKKDSKNNRKAALAAIAATPTTTSSYSASGIQANQVAAASTTTSEHNIFHQSFNSPSNLQMQNQLQITHEQSPPQQQPLQNLQQSAAQIFTTTSQPDFAQSPECRLNRSAIERNANKHQHQQIVSSVIHDANTISCEPLRNSNIVTNDDVSNQLAPNETILQLVAQIPNHPLQKIAQKLIVDRPKSSMESHSKNTLGDSATPVDTINVSDTSPDIADISRIFFEVIRSELNANQMPEFVIHQKPCAAHTNTGNLEVTPPESDFEQDSNQSKQSGFVDQHDDHLSMFSVEEADGKNIYPDIENALKGFSSGDASQQRTREANSNYEWADDIDVLNILHNVNDWPATLQEWQIANFNDNTEYASYIGLDSACKMRWAGQWPQNVGDIPQQNVEKLSPTDEQLDQQQIMTIEHQLHQQLQQQFCVEQFQLLNQLQNQQQDPISLVSSSMVDLKKQSSKIDMQTIQPHFQIPTSNTSNSPITNQSLELQTDSSEQTKFVFNVDTDKTSPSLQLLFQLPNTSGATAQTSSVLTPTTPTQNVCTTQMIQPKQNNLQHTTGDAALPNSTFVYGGGIIHHPCQIITQNQVLPLCNQHSQQVQVATQTPQQTAVPKAFPTLNSNQSTTNFLENPSSSPQLSQQIQPQPQQQQPITPGKFPTSASKKTIDKSRRERKTIMRQTTSNNQNTSMQQLAISTQAGADKTIDVDTETDSNHDTALTLACAGGHEELVELLIQRDANIEHRDKKGFTPLILAATAGHEKVVNILLKHGAELEAQSERTKDTPLSLACSGGRYEVVEILLSVGANKEHRNVSDYTPLSLAASGGYVNIIRLLLNHGAEINSRTGSKLGISPLMLAAMNGHTAAVKLLLDMGSDINAQIETNRNTALTLACFQGRHEVVSLLLDRKANVEHRAKTGLTPLMEAASGGYIDVGWVLLDKGADVNATPVPSSRDTALTIAADKGHLKFVDLLLARGAAVEVKNKKGNSPLWLAANGGHLAVVKVLKNHNADIDSQDNRRVSCLMAAFRKGHTIVVEFMVNHVTQFPSDQEMTRYISTVSDKNLSEKCKECVKIIRAAKEAQAVKAYKNASILLEELDMEKNREENRKAAAARRRERKKKKKMEKKEEKRKQLETEKRPEKGADKAKGAATECKEITSPEKEETDSGIDVHSQGSYSSADNKTGASTKNIEVTNSKANNSNKSDSSIANAETNRKNAKSNKSKKTKSPNRSQESDEDKEVSNNKNSNSKTNNHNIDQAHATENNNRNIDNVGDNNNVNNNNTNNNSHHQQQKDGKHRNNIAAHSSREKDVAAQTNNFRGKEKERSRSKEETHNEKVEIAAKSSAHESTVLTSAQNKSSKNAVHNDDFTIEMETTYFNSTRNKVNKNNQNHESGNTNNKNASTKPTLAHTFKREEGWKEVSRKSSTQQHTVSETACKKVIVPTHAISRVIGRAGSNINAIRAATGAHIEVEKQGKTQNDRCITIKGSLDATKQAYILITALIKDPEVDILQMLPKVNNNARSVPPSNIGEKSASVSIQQTVNASIASTTNAIGTKPIKTVTTTTISSPSISNKPVILTSVSSTQRINHITKSTALNQSRTMNANNRVIVTDNTMKKTETKASTVDHSGLTALKNTIKNSTAESFGTFAAKLASDLRINSSTESSQSHSSPKHNATSVSTGHAAFSNAIFAHDKTVKPHMTQNYSSTVQSSSEVTTAASTMTSVSSSMANRIITSSPTVNLAHSSLNSGNQASANLKLAQSRHKQGVQLPLTQSHEYSLFNNSFANSSQWEQKSNYNAGNGDNYLENDPFPKADASKAPGYRGANLNSPINLKHLKLTKNETKTQLSEHQQNKKDQEAISTQKQTDSLDHEQQKKDLGLKSETDDLQLQDKNIDNEQTQELEKQQIAAHISPIGTAPTKHQTSVGNQLHIVTSQSSIKTNSSAFASAVGSESFAPGVIRPPPMQSLSSSDLTTPRSLTQNQLRMMPAPIDSMNVENKGQPSNYYDASYRNMNYGNSDMQSPFQQGLVSNQLPMSRLNPRASVFSSIQNNNAVGKAPNQMPLMNQPYGRSGMYQPNPNQPINSNFNPYQKLPFSNQNAASGGGGGSQFYNRAPGRPQSQPQASSTNGRMFSEFAHPSHTSPNDTFNMDHGNIGMPLSSASMSPNGNNNPQVTTNKNVLQHSVTDDNRKMPRPIGTERASWKHNVIGGGINTNLDNAADSMNQHSIPPWLLEKNHLQQNQPMAQQQSQQPPNSQPWMQYPIARNPYSDEMHIPDQFQQVPMDYYNTMLPQNQPPMMQSMHYSQLAPPEIGQQDLWDHDKHGWSKWTN